MKVFSRFIAGNPIFCLHLRHHTNKYKINMLDLTSLLILDEVIDEAEREEKENENE
jgi:hypothetical protein